MLCDTRNIQHRATRRTYCAIAVALALAVGGAACNSDTVTTTSNPVGLPTGSFDIGLPAALAIRQGGTTILEVNISRSAYVGPVFVTVAALPTGVTAPSVSSTSTNQLRMTLGADTLAATGPATVQVTAQASDVPTVTRSFVLTVSPR